MSVRVDFFGLGAFSFGLGPSPPRLHLNDAGLPESPGQLADEEAELGGKVEGRGGPGVGIGRPPVHIRCDFTGRGSFPRGSPHESGVRHTSPVGNRDESGLLDTIPIGKPRESGLLDTTPVGRPRESGLLDTIPIGKPRESDALRSFPIGRPRESGLLDMIPVGKPRESGLLSSTPPGSRRESGPLRSIPLGRPRESVLLRPIPIGNRGESDRLGSTPGEVLRVPLRHRGRSSALPLESAADKLHRRDSRPVERQPASLHQQDANTGREVVSHLLVSPSPVTLLSMAGRVESRVRPPLHPGPGGAGRPPAFVQFVHRLAHRPPRGGVERRVARLLQQVVNVLLDGAGSHAEQLRDGRARGSAQILPEDERRPGSRRRQSAPSRTSATRWLPCPPPRCARAARLPTRGRSCERHRLPTKRTPSCRFHPTRGATTFGSSMRRAGPGGSRPRARRPVMRRPRAYPRPASTSTGAAASAGWNGNIG